jgi:hypothetical protein
MIARLLLIGLLLLAGYLLWRWFSARMARDPRLQRMFSQAALPLLALALLRWGLPILMRLARLLRGLR